MAQDGDDETPEVRYPPNLVDVVLFANRSPERLGELAALLWVEREYGVFITLQFRAFRARRVAPLAVVQLFARVCDAGRDLCERLKDDAGALEWRSRHAELLRQVHGKRRGRTPPRSKEDRAKIAVAWGRGDSQTEIARMMGVSRQAFENWLEWPEMEIASAIRPKRPRSTRRLGNSDRDVAAPDDSTE